MGKVELSPTTSVKRIQEGSISDLQNSKSGNALADIFNKDTLTQVPFEKEEVQSPSFWNKLAQMMPWNATEIPSMQITKPVSSAIEPVSRIPVIPKPDEIELNIPASSIEIEAAPLTAEKQQKIAAAVNQADQVVQALHNHPSDHPAVVVPAAEMIKKIDQMMHKDNMSIEEIMNHAYKLVIERQEESGVVSSELFKKFNEMAKYSREVYQQLEDKAKGDEKVASALGYTQAGLGIAVFATTLICAASFFFPPVGAALPVALSTVQSVGAFLGLGTALTKGGEAYFKGRKNQNSADALERDNQRTIFKDAGTSASDRMMNALETVQEAQEQLIKTAHEHDRQISIIQQS